ncbi:hypothetical protein PO587_10610 [Streptomyces gilvifuscus]|uniref:Uncharacterized protein n=1 Tax=Streptomyces gilvifuscus TaxID=1550617 RepID=A0ABT5FR23_9ACTN|nr:hypothetical protein [Streptomyces gilvifuscus]MDC2954916.1 hypothetical protein [Streptomyces gilvifuscus]
MANAAGGLHGREQEEFVSILVGELVHCRFLDESSSRRTVGEHLGLPPEVWEGTLPAFRVELARHVSLDLIDRVYTLCTVVGWYDEARRESLWRQLQAFLTERPEAEEDQGRTWPAIASPAVDSGTRLSRSSHNARPPARGAARSGPLPPAPVVASAAPQLPSPFTADEYRRVESLLRLDQHGPQEMHELQDNIAFELGFPVPGAPSTPLDLFAALVDFNSSADHIPPSVVALEWVAALAVDKTIARQCRQWAERWAREHDCLPALQRRRHAREQRHDNPQVPRALLIMVEPAEDGSDDVTVRYWINDLAGHWAPRAGEATETRMNSLGDAVERALAEGERLWATSRADPVDQLPPFVEFILPYLLLNHDVARLEIGANGPEAAAIGPRYCVHLRSLERLRRVPHDPFITNRWHQRWQELHQQGTRLHHWTHDAGITVEHWSRSLTHRQHGSAQYTALALDAPRRGSDALTALKRAIAEGFGLVLWDRRGKLEPRIRETLTELLNGSPTTHDLPRRVQEMRARAEADADGDVFLGRHVAFLWDDPERIVDCQSGHPAPDDAAGLPYIEPSGISLRPVMSDSPSVSPGPSRSPRSSPREEAP